MARLRGRGLGKGLALGTTAVVRVRNGIPLPPELPARLAEQIAARRLSEIPEIILAAEDYRTALALSGSLSWAKVVGIAAESDAGNAPVPAIPVVTEIKGLLDLAQGDQLMLVDADRGIVLIDPDPAALAQYTAEHDNMIPRRRHYLEEAHLPVQTVDGRSIRVTAVAASFQEMAQGLEAGADALFLPYAMEELRSASQEEALRRNVLEVTERAGGKPLILSDDYSLPLTLVAEMAARAEVTLAVPPLTEREGLEQLREAFQAAELECDANNIACSVPRLAVNFQELPETLLPEEAAAQMEALAALGISRIVVSLERGGGMLEDMLLPLSVLAFGAQTNLMPLSAAVRGYSFMDETLETSLRVLIGAGVSELLIMPGDVIEAKRCLREMNAEECREMVRQYLEGRA